jgi:hypothetical protein
MEARVGERVCYVAAALNVIAGAFMLLVLRHGLPGGGSTASSRAAYVTSHVVLWRVGWLSWHLAAFSLIALIVVLADLFRTGSPLACSLALVFAAAGLAGDLAAEALLAGLAHVPASFGSAETIPLLLTGYVGNGLYTLAGILVTWAGRRRLPSGLLYLAGLVLAGGVWLSIATLVGSNWGETASTAIAIPAFIAWAALLGRWMGSADEVAPSK